MGQLTFFSAAWPDPGLPAPARPRRAAAPRRSSYRLAVSRVRDAGREGDALDSPAAVEALWRAVVPPREWYSEDKECVVVFLADVRHAFLGWHLVSLGAFEAFLHPREVLRPVLVAAAHGFVVAHNHPSGDPAPSGADLRVAARLQEGARLLQVAMLDFCIAGGPGRFYSWRDAGHGGG